MLPKKFITLMGITLLCFSAIFFAYSNYEERNTIWSNALCPQGCPLAIVYVTYNTKMSLQSSQSIEVHTELSSSGDCQLNDNEPIRFEAELSAPGFEIEPSSVQNGFDQTLTQGNKDRMWVWVAKPKDVGTYEMAAKISAYSGNCEIGSDIWPLDVVVVDLFGLNALQLKIATYITGFLGSALTLTGLREMWSKRKKSESKTATTTPQDTTVKLIVSAKGDEKEIDRNN
jgi:hypothetical protein